MRYHFTTQHISLLASVQELIREVIQEVIQKVLADMTLCYHMTCTACQQPSMWPLEVKVPVLQREVNYPASPERFQLTPSSSQETADRGM